MPPITDLPRRPLSTQISYWKEQLAGCPDALELPCDRPSAATQTYRAAVHSFALPQNLTAAAEVLSRAENATLFATLLTAWQTLLHRYTGATDLIIGTTAAPPSASTARCNAPSPRWAASPAWAPPRAC